VVAQCRWCDRLIPDNSRHCPYCGQVFELEIACEKCGLPVPVGVRLCTNCGHFQDLEIPDEEPPDADTPEGLPPAERSDDSISTWYAAGHDEKTLWDNDEWRRETYSARSDPVYYSALLCSVTALFFIFIPLFSTVLAVVSLLLAAFGYYRRYQYGKKYGGFSLNIIASIIGPPVLLLSLFIKVQV